MMVDRSPGVLEAAQAATTGHFRTQENGTEHPKEAALELRRQIHVAATVARDEAHVGRKNEERARRKEEQKRFRESQAGHGNVRF